MVSKFLVELWLLAYGKFRIRGTGTLIKLMYPILPGLKHYPLDVPQVGTVYLDFGTETAFAMLTRLKLFDLESDVGLYREMEKYLKPGSTLWDVGAFVGYLSAHFSQPRFQLSAIHAFEPNPESLALLRSLCGKLDRVHIHPFALGSREETKSLHVPSGRAAMASVVNEEGSRTIEVAVKTGDRVRKDMRLPMPDVIKIDVEGFEPEVLKGLTETVQKCRPVIFFEHIFLNSEQILALVPEGYRLMYIQDDGQVTSDPAARQKGHDAMLLPPDHQPAN